MLAPRIVAEVVVPRTGGQDQEVIVDGSGFGLDTPRREVHPRDFGEDDLGVLL